ncbi:MAG: 6-phosphogluconolactonase [Alphaproteobacteria bacterium]|nr:6-phosphogluconolactonase [Alphaproteobacteria bacterium]
MRVRLRKTSDDIAAELAGDILARFKSAQAAGRNYLLGCPSGRSPKPTYDALAALFAETEADLSGLILVMMDEYVEGDPPSFRYVDKDRHYSCRRFADVDMAAQFNAGLPRSKHLPADNIWFPDPVQSAAYDEHIAAAGGIDLFILASGAGDGHVAFNPPGSGRQSRSRVTELAEQTKRDNLNTFPDFRSLDEVPRYGVTVGIATIIDQAKSAAMILSGESKRKAFDIISQATSYAPDWPATVIVECRNAVLYADASAAGKAVA